MSQGKDKKHYRRDASGAPGRLTRRKFLGLSALAGAAAVGAPVIARAGQRQGAPEFGGWPGAYGMLSDFTRCVGCRSCERACNEVNHLPVPETPFDDASVFEKSRWPSAGAYTVVNRYRTTDPSRPVMYRKIQCNHCLEPACATACPIHAYTKTPEGPVLYDKDLCFGCRCCVISCPFNMPAYDYGSALDAKIVKCIFCYPRIKEGKLPACAEACPGGALTFGRRDELLKVARERISGNPGRYIDHIYGEHEAGGTSWLYLSSVPYEQLGFPTGLPDKPLVELAKGFESSVPVIFTTFPAIFGMIYGIMRGNEKAAREAASKEAGGEEVRHG
ncbi:MAG: 4Fe-4S dicluster domain-containing protein [Nitrospiraceae bacterium]|nr:4Fe-4S dicluster domain-containing protein [Nitrospiraceae bacterium]